MKPEHHLLKIYITAVALLVLMLVVAFSFSGEPPLPLRVKKRLPVAGEEEQCQHVGAPWGSACRISSELCEIKNYTPLFFSDNRIIYFKLVTNESLPGGKEEAIDFTVHKSMDIDHQWDETPVLWVEWYIRSPGKEYDEIPDKGCYCNEREGVVYICTDGRVREIREP